MSPNLLWFIIIPIIAAIITFALPFLNAKSLKRFAFLCSLLPLLMLIFQNTSLLGEDVNFPWLSVLSINFHLHVDSLSYVFLFLANVIIPISILAASSPLIAPHCFFGLILLLQGILNGFFTTEDLAVFTFFWEAMLVPLYFIINIWGGKEKQKASYTFIIYMIAGSALMVLAVLALHFSALSSGQTSTFDIPSLAKFSETIPYAPLLCAIFLLAFSVKTPLFPFHGWLPVSYCEASTTGTILLSAILSKGGVYGILRISLGLFPNIMREWSPLLLDLAIIGVLYGAIAAWAQTDFKRLIAYSSFSHINFVLAGLFVWDSTAQSGAILQALNHAITITGLFLLAGLLEERLGSTRIDAAGGLAKYMPSLCWITLFFVFSAIALPGLNSFVGEVLILYGVFGQNAWLAGVLGLTVILSVVYMLRWIHSIYFEIPSPFQKNWIDIRPKEIWVFVPLIGLILWLGIYPMPALRQIEPAAQKIMSSKTAETK
jgi:NADH-quinone oxidoreductase subunit M